MTWILLLLLTPSQEEKESFWFSGEHPVRDVRRFDLAGYSVYASKRFVSVARTVHPDTALVYYADGRLRHFDPTIPLDHPRAFLPPLTGR